jgi:hypothetical protein
VKAFRAGRRDNAFGDSAVESAIGGNKDVVVVLLAGRVVSLGHIVSQANKCIRWMPRHKPATKDVASCEKPRGAASERRSGGIRMGQPGGGHTPSPKGANPGN